ncbi:MAG: 1-aminocyclopropane-1-carboxylate deaminase/D-cysteine desulfhydrase [Spongiibacteraceae bacterium]
MVLENYYSGWTKVTHPLLAVYPQLGPVLPVRKLAELPTPVEALAALAPNAWVKRDDLTHPEYGGNKIRKLEFILAEAIAQGKKHVVTFGAIGTNHGVATSMLCRELGLRCSVLLFDQPVTTTVRDNLQQMHYYDANLCYCGSLANTVRSYYLNRWRLRSDSYFLFAGGSNVAGTIGFVNAAFELRDQIEQGQCPLPAEIIVPVGSSASLAGLSIGVALAGLNCAVRGVRVAPSHLGPFEACTTATVTKLMVQVVKRLRRYGVTVPTLPPPILDDDFYGGGYGVATDTGSAAKDRFAEHGIQLEQTYTAKAADAYLRALEKSREPVLYWHTFNSRPVPSALYDRALPAQLEALLNNAA